MKKPLTGKATVLLRNNKILPVIILFGLVIADWFGIEAAIFSGLYIILTQWSQTDYFFSTTYPILDPDWQCHSNPETFSSPAIPITRPFLLFLENRGYTNISTPSSQQLVCTSGCDTGTFSTQCSTDEVYLPPLSTNDPYNSTRIGLTVAITALIMLAVGFIGNRNFVKSAVLGIMKTLFGTIYLPIRKATKTAANYLPALLIILVESPKFPNIQSQFIIQHLLALIDPSVEQDLDAIKNSSTDNKVQTCQHRAAAMRSRIFTNSKGQSLDTGSPVASAHLIFKDVFSPGSRAQNIEDHTTATNVEEAPEAEIAPEARIAPEAEVATTTQATSALAHLLKKCDELQNPPPSRFSLKNCLSCCKR